MTKISEIKNDKACRELVKTNEGYEVRKFIIGYKHPLFQEIVNYFEYLNDKSKTVEYKEYDSKERCDWKK